MDRRYLLPFLMVLEALVLYFVHSQQYEISYLLVNAISFGVLDLRKYCYLITLAALPFLHPYVILAAAIASLGAYYLGTRAVDFITPVAIYFALYNAAVELQLFALLILVGCLLYFQKDVRGLMGGGVALIVGAAVAFSIGLSTLSNQLSDLAFLSLLLGVVGVGLEGRSRSQRIKYLSLLVFPSVVAYIGPSLSYYFWTPNSLYFRADPLSLWVPAVYHPVLNQLMGTWLVSRLSLFLGYLGARIYIFITTLISGLTSYYAFRSWRNGLLFVLAYQLSSPFFAPELAWGFALLPLVVGLANSKLRPWARYPLMMLASVSGSSFYLFPASLTASLRWVKGERIQVFLALLGANFFWILPYVIWGGPSLTPLQITYPLLFTLAVIAFAASVQGDAASVLIVVGSAAFLILHLPFYEAAYPTLIFGLLSLINSVQGRGREISLGFTLLLLALSSAQTVISLSPLHNLEIPSFNSVSVEDLTFWNYSYPLASPVPINGSTIPVTAIKYIVGPEGNVVNNTEYLGFPGYTEPIYNSTNYQVNGTWTEIPPRIQYLSGANLTPTYHSVGLLYNLTPNGLSMNSQYGMQLAAWPLPSTNTLSININSSSETYLFLGPTVNVTSGFPFYGVLISPPGAIFRLVNGVPKYLATIPHGPSATILLNESQGIARVYGEYFNYSFIPLNVNTTLPWGQLLYVGVGVERNSPVLLKSISIGSPFPLNVSSNQASWDSEGGTVIFRSLSPLNGTLLVGTSPIIGSSLLVKAISGNGTVETGELRDAIELSFTSTGVENITTLQVINNGIHYYILNYPGAEEPTINFTVKESLGGLTVHVSSNSLFKLHLQNICGITYSLNGVVMNYTTMLKPGSYLIMATFQGQNYLIYGGIVTLISFILAGVLGVSAVRNSLKKTLKAIEGAFNPKREGVG